MKFLNFLIRSNIFISLCAVAYAIQAQVEIGQPPHYKPYLWLLFFGTFFEYNLHRLITLLFRRKAFDNPKHAWVKKHKFLFYLICIFSAIGLFTTLLLADKKYILALLPFAFVTLFYSLPVFSTKNRLFRLREIPFLKIFLISIVWAGATMIFPLMESGADLLSMQTGFMFAGRVLFIFSITIPFDIRDMVTDREAGLATIPLKIGDGKALKFSGVLLLAFVTVGILQYTEINHAGLLFSYVLSGVVTWLVLINRKLQNLPLYHYGILDGMILLQAVLVVAVFLF